MDRRSVLAGGLAAAFAPLLSAGTVLAAAASPPIPLDPVVIKLIDLMFDAAVNARFVVALRKSTADDCGDFADLVSQVAWDDPKIRALWERMKAGQA